MLLSNVIKGMLLLQPYYTNSDGYHVGAERNEVIMYHTSKPLPEEVINEMRTLGWFQLDKNYNAEGSWRCRV